MEQAIILGSICTIAIVAIEETIRNIKYTAKAKTLESLRGFKLCYEDIGKRRLHNARAKVSNLRKPTKQSKQPDDNSFGAVHKVPTSPNIRSIMYRAIKQAEAGYRASREASEGGNNNMVQVQTQRFRPLHYSRLYAESRSV